MAMGSPASPRNVGAVQPPRAARLLHTRRILSKPSRHLPFPLFPLYRAPRSSFSHPLRPSPFLVLALLRHPRRGFLSSVSLCLPFPRRAVASRAAFTRAYTLLASHACIYRSHTRPLSHTALASRDACRAASPSRGALLSGLAPRRQDPPDYNVCVFYEPRRTALASANALDFRVALIALEGGGQSAACVDFLVLDVVTFRLFALCRSQLRETNVSPLPSRIFRALIKVRLTGRASNRVGATFRCKCAL